MIMFKIINNILFCVIGFSLFIFATCGLAEQQTQPLSNIYKECDKFPNPKDKEICRSNVDELMAPTRANALIKAEEQKTAQNEQDAKDNAQKAPSWKFNKLETPKVLQFPVQVPPNTGNSLQNATTATQPTATPQQTSPNPMIWNKPPPLPANKPYPIPMPNQPQTTPSNVNINTGNAGAQQTTNDENNQPPPNTSIYH